MASNTYTFLPVLLFMQDLKNKNVHDCWPAMGKKKFLSCFFSMFIFVDKICWITLLEGHYTVVVDLSKEIWLGFFFSSVLTLYIMFGCMYACVKDRMVTICWQIMPIKIHRIFLSHTIVANKNKGSDAVLITKIFHRFCNNSPGNGKKLSK